MLKDRSEPFCANPFEFFEVTDNGDVFICCPGWVPKTIGNLEKDDLMEIWNSEAAQIIRKSIIDGSFKYCQAKECPLIESNILPYKKDVLDPYLKEVLGKGLTIINKKPKILKFSYDRSCNLVCPSCRTSKIMIKGEDYRKKHRIQSRLVEAGLDDTDGFDVGATLNVC